MFAALSENGDFFRPKCKACVLLAPVASLQNMNSPLFNYLRDDEKAWAAFQLQGNEIVKNATANNLIDQKKGEYTAKYTD